ncbi:MAG: RNA polymerase sigma factor [Chloroflexota bacterium]|jgi:RNA polymerase sigma-70 factor (ECF subfamily)
MTETRRGSPEELALVRKVAGGSEDALAALYDRYGDGVYAAAIRLTDDRQIAEEVVQETFLALWNRAELFDPATGSLAAWLHTIARNRVIDRLRAAGRRPNLVPLSAAGGETENDTSTLERIAVDRPVVGGADLGPGPELELEANELQATLRHVLAGMPEIERTVILLAYREELSQTEIAARLGWPLGTVKTRTRRALQRLRSVLETREGMRRGPLRAPLGAGEGQDG